jgi:glycosyltransferase involved in cell wall biosynthesis
MNISFSTPVANLKTANGYGNALKKIIESLNELGYATPFQDFRAPVQLNFSQPPLFKMHKNQYQISYTPWESTIIPDTWKTNLNLVDEIWTTSDWCANVFEDNGFKDIKVYPHGIDSIWKPRKRSADGVIKFLHIGEPAVRKAGQLTVDAFIELFGNDPRYSLTIKAFNHSIIRVYNNKIDNNIVGLPHELYSNITTITDDYSEEQLLELYYNHDVLIYPSYGEGFGFIPLQALATGMPTICTGAWAHYKKFLGPLQLKSKMIESPWQYPHSGNVFEPNYKHLLELMKDVVSDYSAYSGFYYAQSNKIHNEYNWLQLTKNAFDPVIKKFS